MDDFRSGNVEYSVPLKTLIEEFKLETLYIPEGRKIKISQPEVNRPGLALSGFFEFFDHNRVQLIGNAENFAANQEKVLADLAKMGYTTVETANYGNGKIYGLAPEDFKACMDKAGLKALSTHTTRGLSAEELKAGAANEETMKWWDECIAAHKAAGMEYVVTPSQPTPETLKDLQVW